MAIMERRLYPEERYRRILAELEQSGRVSVEEMSRLLGISQVTLRSDLQYLASMNLLVRTHGGAIPAEAEDEGTFSNRIEAHSPQKVRIGRAAAALVEPGDVIGLDASTTALAIASFLEGKQEVTVVTNSLAVANQLLQVPGISVYVVGGFLRRDALSLVDLPQPVINPALTMRYFFFSAHSLSTRTGLSEMNPQEGAWKASLMDYCQAAIAVVDSSKFGRAGLHPFAQLAQIKRIISDRDAPADYVERIRAAGVEVTLV
jgi:DeoR family transcriptional regulator of aga operon